MWYKNHLQDGEPGGTIDAVQRESKGLRPQGSWAREPGVVGAKGHIGAQTMGQIALPQLYPNLMWAAKGLTLVTVGFLHRV